LDEVFVHCSHNKPVASGDFRWILNTHFLNWIIIKKTGVVPFGAEEGDGAHRARRRTTEDD
jgi:hypothetical protein